MKQRWFELIWTGGLILFACQQGSADLSAEQLSSVVDAARPALQQCYQDALDKSPRRAELKFQAVIHVETSGEVSSIELDLKGVPALSDCVSRVIVGLHFPKADAATHASLPLVFRPEEPAQPL